MKQPNAKIGAFVLSCLLTTAPSLTQPHHIAKLGEAPLLGAASSRAQLRAQAERYEARLEIASRELGMSAEEFRAFKLGLASAHYVVVPRHLDAMAWHNGVTYVTSDVVIPSGTRGWEVDVRHADRVLRVFIPASCGNLSILRQMLPRVAKAPAVKFGVMAYSATPGPMLKQPPKPAFQPTGQIPAPASTAAIVSQATPAATPPPAPEVAAIHPAPAVRSHRFPWFVLGLIVPLLFHGGGGGGGEQHAFIPPVIPTPSHCPSR